MVYSAFTIGEVDQDSPLDATFFTKMKDNFDALRDGSGFNLNNDVIPYGAIASGAVGQTELKTTTEEDSKSGSGTQLIVTSAGEYGFVPVAKSSTTNTTNMGVLGGVMDDVSLLGVTSYTSNPSDAWDSGLWDTAIWGGGYDEVRRWTSPDSQVGYYASGKLKIETINLEKGRINECRLSSFYNRAGCYIWAGSYT